MKQSTLVAIILGILLLISVVQAFQLNTIKNKVASGTLSVSSASSGSPSASGAASGANGKQVGQLPANIQDLPQMVGGC